MERHRKKHDEKLERLYSKKIKCPYCRAYIRKYTKKCLQCGITKEQIRHASNKEAKKIIKGQAEGRVLKTRVRPDDVNFTRMIMFVVFLGLFGAHCFYVGRRIRGWIVLGGFIIFMLSAIIFPFGTPDAGFSDMHPLRQQFDNMRIWFPLDIPGLLAVFIWVYDWVAVVITQRFKYPVRLPKVLEMKEKNADTEDGKRKSITGGAGKQEKAKSVVAEKENSA
ncbi:MAG: TM2 domain-containing protein [Firmicutes bacterium]|nr:TM2 domain-containing protein [Bacillota bacterium]